MNFKNSLVSVIVLNHNGVGFLKKCLFTIYKQTYSPLEIIVVDNASTDKSLNYLKSQEKVKVLKLTKNYGYTGANNRAARIAKGRFLLFINNDIELFTDCIEKLVTNYKEKSILSARQIPTWNKKFYGGAGGGSDIFGYPYVEDDPKKTKVFYADGANFFIAKKDFIDLGMFDEKLFIFQEDIDLCWRALMQGYIIVPCWSAKVYHYGGATIKGGSSGKNKSRQYTSSYFRRFLNEKNIIRNLLKNYSILTLIVVFPILLFLHLVEIIVLMMLLHGRAAFCYMQAYWWNIRNLPDTLSIRKKIQSKRTVGDLKIITQRYFVYSKINSLIKVGIPQFQ